MLYTNGDKPHLCQISKPDTTPLSSAVPVTTDSAFSDDHPTQTASASQQKLKTKKGYFEKSFSLQRQGFFFLLGKAELQSSYLDRFNQLSG